MKYFTSDPHYSHINICRGVSRWGKLDEDGNFIVSEDSTRDFKTLEDMNDAIVNAINSAVGKEDELYLLGDVSFNGIENLWNFRKRINCETIHLIFGNHDHHIEKNRVLPNCHWDPKNPHLIKDGPNPNLYGDSRDNMFDVYARQLFTTVKEFSTIKIDKKTVVMSHYPLEQWKDMDLGSWHLFGHCHGKLPVSEFKRMDVGLDANGFKVLSFDDIRNYMSNKKIKQHHGI